MGFSIKDAGTWKAVAGFFVRDAGTWKSVVGGYVRDAGVWKQFWGGGGSGLAVVLPDRTIVAAQTNPAGANPTISLTFANDGTHKSTINLGSAVDTPRPGEWLSTTPQLTAVTSLYEIRFTLDTDFDTGTISGVTLNTWLNLGTTRVLTYALFGSKLSASARLKIEIREASSGVLRRTSYHTVNLSKESVIKLTDRDLTDDDGAGLAHHSGYDLLTFQSNGVLTARSKRTGATITLSGEWRSDAPITANSDYQIRFQLVTLNDNRVTTQGTLNTWQTLNSNRTLGIVIAEEVSSGNMGLAYATYRVSIRRSSDSALMAERIFLLGYRIYTDYSGA